jgi:hypothetical protein
MSSVVQNEHPCNFATLWLKVQRGWTKISNSRSIEHKHSLRLYVESLWSLTRGGISPHGAALNVGSVCPMK